jgi:hypothetical protein
MGVLRGSALIRAVFWLAAVPSDARSRRRIPLRLRLGLADRLGPELRQGRPQRADARREGVTVALDDVV